MGSCMRKLPWDADLTSSELLIEQIRRFQYNKAAGRGKGNLQQTPSPSYHCRNDLKEKYSNFVQTPRGWRISQEGKNYSSFSVAHNLSILRIHSHSHQHCCSKFMPWYIWIYGIGKYTLILNWNLNIVSTLSRLQWKLKHILKSVSSRF